MQEKVTISLRKDDFIRKGRVTDGKIAKIKKKINERPRKKLNFATPTMAFYKHIM